MAKKIKSRTRKPSRKKPASRRIDIRGLAVKREHLNIVLVGSLYDWNVGSVSRVMTNMGGNRLILVRPKCEFSFTAQQAAATGQRPYQTRTVYENWEQFNSKEAPGIRIAFTALDGDKRRTKTWASVLASKKIKSQVLHAISKENQPLYLIFGPEDHGLLASEMDLTNFNVCLPVDKENESLNLSHSVLLALHMLREKWGVLPEKKTKAKVAEPEVFFPDQLLRDWLMELGYQVDDRRRSIFSVLKRTLLENVPTRRDLEMLEGLFQQALRKTKEYNELRMARKKKPEIKVQQS